MSRPARIAAILASLLIMLLLTTSVVLADFIEFTDSVITCSSASFSYLNTTTDPNTSDGSDFAWVTVRNLDTNEVLYEDFLNPYDDSASTTFEAQPAGSVIEISVKVSQRIFGSVSGLCSNHELSGGDDSPLLWGPPCDNLFDGRINDSPALDCAAPVAIYFDATLNTVYIYGIHPQTGDGQLAATIVLTDGATDANSNQTVITTTHPWYAAPLIFSRLSTGEWQLTTSYADGKPYIVAWSSPEDLYHLAA